ncbi:MAG: hypothetical protein ABIO81_01135 [Ginsengibacter sp.]
MNDNSVANIKKGIERIKRTTHIPIEEKIETNEPPVEEKSPEINTPDIIASGMEKKSVQRTSIRSYNNNHIPLSSHKKGGIKPFGKKPLW